MMGWLLSLSSLANLLLPRRSNKTGITKANLRFLDYFPALD
jgi:hypothetical protein